MTYMESLECSVVGLANCGCTCFILIKSWASGKHKNGTATYLYFMTQSNT